jgi:hypothetical protein
VTVVPALTPENREETAGNGAVGAAYVIDAMDAMTAGCKSETDEKKIELTRLFLQPAHHPVVYRDAIHQLLHIILQLRILVVLLVSTLPYVVKVKNYS